MPKNKALFLDRDGVINVDHCYVHRQEDFHFLEGIFDLCRAAQDLGYLLIIVTNQAGIGRGYYTESDYLQLTEWMTNRFAAEDIRIAEVYYCPDHPIHGVGKYKRESPDRKPNPGMLLRAREDFDLDMASSVLIGDKLSDMRAAQAAGVATRILFADPSAAKTEEADYASGSLDEIRRRFFSQPAGLEKSKGAHLANEDDGARTQPLRSARQAT